MKVLYLVVHKLWPRLKFLSTDDGDDAGAMTIVLRKNSPSLNEYRSLEVKMSELLCYR